MTAMWLANGWRVIVDGDAAGGWICEVHDGNRCETYTIQAADSASAREQALAAHGFVAATEEPTEEPTEGEDQSWREKLPVISD